MRPRLSIVTSSYLSEGYIEEFHRRMTAAAAALTPSFEIIYVDDASPDRALDTLIRIQKADPRVTVVELARNYGQAKALMTGLAHARGSKVFMIDADLEEAPELIRTFDEEVERTGNDVVFGVQRARKGGRGERFFGSIFYRAFNLLSTEKIVPSACMIRMMSRRYVDNLLRFRERELFFGGVLALTGFKQSTLPVDKGSRGATTYTLARKLNLLTNSITSFSSRPLTLIFWLGLAIMLVSLGAAIGFLVLRAFYEFRVGWLSVVLSVWFLGGMVQFSVGLIGIYLSKVFSETKRRPRTIVARVHRAEARQHVVPARSALQGTR